MSNEFDIRGYKQKGHELAKLINDEIALSQKYILTPLPDVLVMTQEQYDDLHKIKGLEPMYKSEDQIFVTPHNVMECRVR